MARRPRGDHDKKPARFALEPMLYRTFHLKCGARRGTCFAIDVEGRQYLVTATHLLRGLMDGAIVEILHGGKWKPLDVRVVGYGPPQVDVAVLALKFRIARPEFQAIPSMAGLALGQEAWCLGFPRGEWLPGPAEAPRFPSPFVKKVCVSSLPGAVAAARCVYLDGQRNPGFVGGPVVFRDPDGDGVRIAAMVSALECDGEPIYLGTEPLHVSTQHNPDIIVSYDVKHALDVISLNPIGVDL